MPKEKVSLVPRNQFLGSASNFFLAAGEPDKWGNKQERDEGKKTVGVGKGLSEKKDKCQRKKQRRDRVDLKRQAEKKEIHKKIKR